MFDQFYGVALLTCQVIMTITSFYIALNRKKTNDSYTTVLMTALAFGLMETAWFATTREIVSMNELIVGLIGFGRIALMVFCIYSICVFLLERVKAKYPAWLPPIIMLICGGGALANWLIQPFMYRYDDVYSLRRGTLYNLPYYVCVLFALLLIIFSIKAAGRGKFLNFLIALVLAAGGVVQSFTDDIPAVTMAFTLTLLIITITLPRRKKHEVEEEPKREVEIIEDDAVEEEVPVEDRPLIVPQKQWQEGEVDEILQIEKPQEEVVTEAVESETAVSEPTEKEELVKQDTETSLKDINQAYQKEIIEDQKKQEISQQKQQQRNEKLISKTPAEVQSALSRETEEKTESPKAEVPQEVISEVIAPALTEPDLPQESIQEQPQETEEPVKKTEEPDQPIIDEHTEGGRQFSVDEEDNESMLSANWLADIEALMASLKLSSPEVPDVPEVGEENKEEIEITKEESPLPVVEESPQEIAEEQPEEEPVIEEVSEEIQPVETEVIEEPTNMIWPMPQLKPQSQEETKPAYEITAKPVSQINETALLNPKTSAEEKVSRLEKKEVTVRSAEPVVAKEIAPVREKEPVKDEVISVQPISHVEKRPVEVPDDSVSEIPQETVQPTEIDQKVVEPKIEEKPDIIDLPEEEGDRLLEGRAISDRHAIQLRKNILARNRQLTAILNNQKIVEEDDIDKQLENTQPFTLSKPKRNFDKRIIIYGKRNSEVMEVIEALKATGKYELELVSDGYLVYEMLAGPFAIRYDGIIAFDQPGVTDVYATTRRIKDCESLEVSNLPVVVITSDDPRRHVLLQRSKADRYFLRPVNVEAIIAYLR